MADQTPSEKQEGPQVNQSRAEFIKNDASKILKDDLIGVSDWKRSKIGSLTGFSAAKRSLSTVGNTISDSSSRLSGMYESLTAPSSVPELEDDSGSADERFIRSMELHGKSAKDIEIMVRNTYWTSLLYVGLLVVYLGIVAVWFVIAPTTAPLMIMVRMGIIPLLLALLFKHSYANWMFRKRLLAGPMVYLTSGNILPQRK